MASLRKVRREFRKALLTAVKQGKRNTRDLVALADAHFGSNDCGYHAVLKAFNVAEVNNAVAFLRQEGHIETVGKEWKPVEELDQDDALKITTRRMKQIRGLAKSTTRFAHEHGQIEEAIRASSVVNIVRVDDESEVAEEVAAEVPASVLR
jgi:hypothetical protein